MSKFHDLKGMRAAERADERTQFLAWKAEKAESDRTKGAFCLTPEGREQVRHIFGNDPDSWVWTLFQEVERLEAQARAQAAAAPPSPVPGCERP